MESQFGLTPFGRQRMTHALLTMQQKAREIPEGSAVDKWQLHRWLCEGKSILGISDRTLAVLAALLSFYPENILSETNGLIVFPSNKQLALRAHGMADATLRRHLAALVDAGLVARQDSPNGKRYARRTKTGDVKLAFGFSLAPLLARKDEIEAAAEKVKADKTLLRELREQLTLLRRDIAKTLEYAVEQKLDGSWTDISTVFRTVVDTIPRRASAQELLVLIKKLNEIYATVDNALKNNEKNQNMSGRESQNERQYYESKPDSYIDRTVANMRTKQCSSTDKPLPERTVSLDFVLRACPEITSYAQQPITQWQHLVDATDKVHGFIGIDTRLHQFALKILGRENTAIVIAYLLQRYGEIRSISGYLRILVEKAAEDGFSVRALMSSALHGRHRDMQAQLQ
ncbi:MULTISPECIES: plasmid replication protein RepC [Ochrobactrum]|uniref:Plasmid replication protein RepC n=1 Tax=Ochrobactrum chromiisoli TaxID=2993941 RepID=A0ABT3QP94_9HYPH|nr:plasmid replication protein RepC [Ochrobactrum chromiisoli]MCX2697434.1 plasmid replication protein RepC [Ochrobactrum chromiisoli]